MSSKELLTILGPSGLKRPRQVFVASTGFRAGGVTHGRIDGEHPTFHYYDFRMTSIFPEWTDLPWCGEMVGVEKNFQLQKDCFIALLSLLCSLAGSAAP